jgi:vacuolar-type H+-ATPase subunit E/Vma4
LKAVRFWKRRLGEREDDADNLAAALSASEARVRELEEGVVDPTIQRLRVSLVNVREEHDQLAAALRSLVEAWEQDFDGEDMAVAVAEARSVLDSLPASPTSEGEDG